MSKFWAKLAKLESKSPLIRLPEEFVLLLPDIIPPKLLEIDAEVGF